MAIVAELRESRNAADDSFRSMRKKLRVLPGLIGDTVIGDGLFAQALVIVKAARKTTAFEDQSGLLRASFKARRRSVVVRGRRISGVYAAAIFGGQVTGNSRRAVSARGASSRKGRAYHAHLVEHGHKGGIQKRNGERVNVDTSAAPHSFIAPAVYGTEQQQILSAVRAMDTSLRKLARRLKQGNLTRSQQRALEG